MRIPASFTAAQQSAFCDKEILLLETVESTGQLGGKTVSPGAPVAAYSCNVQYVSDRLLCEQYGLVMGRDIVVTAPVLPVERGAFIRFGGEDYRVVEAPAFDAYKKLLAKAVV